VLYQNIDIQKSIEYDLQNLELSRKGNNQFGESSALNNLAIDYYYMGEYTTALDYLEESLKIRELLQDTVQIVKTLNNLGVISQVSGNYDKAVGFLMRSLEFKLVLGDTLSIAKTLNNIGVICMDTKQYMEAEDFLSKALEYYKSLGDTLGIASAMNNLGQVYGFENKLDLALEYYEQSLELKRKVDDRRGIGNTLNNIGLIYIKKNDNDKAIVYFDEALKIKKEVGDKMGLSSTLNNLAKLYLEAKNYSISKKYYNQSLEIAKEENLMGMMQRNYEGLFLLAEASSNSEEALYYHKLFDEVKDTIFTLNLNEQLAELKVKYETEKTGRENKILRQDNDIQELQISLYREQQIRLIIAIILIVVLSAGIILYLRYRTKIRLNEKLLLLNLKLESGVKERTAELEQANANKDQLYSIIAHDLKNPFNAIIGFTDILDQDFDELNNDRKKELISYLKDLSENAYKLVENLLAWTSSQTGRIKITPKAIDIDDMIRQEMNLSLFQAKRKNITIKHEAGANKKVIADEDTVKTIFRNLLSNAIKFTPDGGDILVCTSLDMNNGNENLVVSIIDSGIGLDAKEVDSIFENSGNTKTSGTGNEPGTGLGLMICKEFINLNHGKIWVVSKKGMGSTFSFSLPVE
jgi:signal transduction histidine kinase